MESHNLLIVPVAATLLASLLIPQLRPSARASAAFLTTIVTAVATSVIGIRVLSGEIFTVDLNSGSFAGAVRIAVDPLSAWFILLVNITCVFGSWYGTRYMRAYEAQQANLSMHWISFLLFHLSMVLVCSVQHGLAFLVVWELMTVSSFLLLMFEHNRFRTLNAGINYLIQMHVGAAFLTVAFIWAAVAEGDFSFVSAERFAQQSGGTPFFLLLFAGFGLKAGFVPLHTWLPHAHPAAPSHVSGVMSAVMVKMGIFGILRAAGWLTTNLTEIGSLILIISAITAFYGILSAAIHRDIKRVLAFSTIENVGLAGMGIAIGLIGKGSDNPVLSMIGFSAALLHALNHALYKSMLFFAAGNIYQLTHTRNMEQLGGLLRRAPATAFFFLCGSIAICGLPPFNGFLSKFLLFSGLIEGMRMADFQTNILMVSAMTGLALVSGGALLTFARSFSVVFLGNARDSRIHVEGESLRAAHAPFFIILFMMLLIGVSPSLATIPLQTVASTFLPQDMVPVSSHLPALSGAGDAGLASLVFILLATAVYLMRTRAVSKRIVRYGPTWACGYPSPITRAQYTGKSFSKTLAKLFSFITPEEKKYEEINPHTVFPAARNYRTSYPEFFEKYIINKATVLLEKFMNYFTFIQHGRVQHYILYGVIFILVVIVASALDLM